jgi:hypothetical protein
MYPRLFVVVVLILGFRYLAARGAASVANGQALS